MIRRLVLPLAAIGLVFVLASCGSGDSSGSDPASVAPPTAPVFIEATVRPEGELKSNVESLAKSIGGIDDPGAKVIAELEKMANDSGDEFDYAKEVEPWLGEKAGLFLQHYDGDDFTGSGIAVQTTDPDATQSFIDSKAKSSDEPFTEGSYEGVDFRSQEDGTTVGVVGDFLVFGEDEASFKAAVDASNGESLAAVDAYTGAVSAAPSDSFADVFVDIGRLIEQAGGPVDPDTLNVLDSLGIDPSEATAVASLVPGSDTVEIDLSTDVGGKNPPSGDASELLGSLPADSVAAFASAEFGKRLGSAIDSIDATGIGDEVPPHKLKSTLKEAGIDLDKITSSLGDLGVFAVGNSERSLAGAVVLTTKSSGEATNTIANIGLLLRATGTPGITAISGKVSGFSIRSAELGRQPVIVAAEGTRIAIAYGLPAASEALATDASEQLSDSPAYEEAVAALDSTPISGFVDGPAALHLAAALVPSTNEGFRKAKRYLTKVDYVAIGAGASDELATAKLILGVGK